MMKISKPVLMSDFTVSHVQFTSLSLINFKNVKSVYDGNEKIQLEYEFPSKVEVSSRDWIGIFPRGWSNLQQYVTFEWISLSKPANPEKSENGDVIRRTIPFCPKYHMNCVIQSALYQFVYVGKQIEVLGVSSYFRFDLSCLNDSNLEIECLVPVTGKVRSTSLSDFGTISMTNEQSLTSIDSRKLMQTSSIHSLQNLDIDGKLPWSRMNITDDKKNMCLLKNAGSMQTGTGDSLNPYSSLSEPGFPMSLPQSQCKKCYQFKRGGDILRSQQALQSKVGPPSEGDSGFGFTGRTIENPYFHQYKLKIVMERNKILEERSQEMKKEMERLQAELKRMKMTYYNVNKEKVAYEKFVKDFIKSLEKDSIVRVMYGNTEILVKKVNYVGMEEHPRDKKTSKRERELKAVIGLQEITIRNLINSLQEKAKSVEELNQTVKLAQVFSAARTDSRDLGIDAEESGDEISNCDTASEYEYSLAKPSPPDEVSSDAEDVLDNIRRTSELELKNIGITRSLVNHSESALDVSNLSIMPYDSENAVPDKPRLMDGIEDCWPTPRNQSVNLRAKSSKSRINVMEEKSESAGAEDSAKTMGKTATREEDAEVDASICEDYYDAFDAFSVRSFSPEVEKLEELSTPSADEQVESDAVTKAVVPQEGTIADGVKCPAEAPVTCGPEKFGKFTCEFSINFVGMRAPNQISGRMICGQEEIKPRQNILAICQQQANGSQVYSLERDRSLITLTKSEKGIEIKITKFDQNQNPRRCFRQKKMAVEYNGATMGKSGAEIAPVCGGNRKLLESPQSEDRSAVSSQDRESVASDTEPEVREEGYQRDPKAGEVDAFSPRTVWNDASDELGDKIIGDSVSSAGLDEPETVSLGKTETLEPEMSPRSQALSKESVKNLKVYQDSLRYEKNLQFLNSKFDGDSSREGDNEALRELPSGIFIRTAEEKVAVIRLQ